jgi:hypothetical protein
VIDFTAEAQLSASIAEAQRLMDENLEGIRALRDCLALTRKPVAVARLARCDFEDGHADCRDRATVSNLRTDLEVCLYHHQEIDREIEKGRWECAQ